MSKDKKRGRISRIRNNLKYENDDPLWKKLFYLKENLKQYKGVVISLALTILVIIICILFVTLSKNRLKNDDIVIKEQTKVENPKEKKRELSNIQDIEKYIDEITGKVLGKNNISEEEKKLREFLLRLYKAGGYSSKNTYIALLKKLNPTYNIGKITEENNVIHVIVKKNENGKEKEEAININNILEELDFDINILAVINKKRIDEKAFKYDDIIIDDEIEKDKIEKFKETVNKDVKNQENSNDNNSNVTGNSGNTVNTPNYGTTVKLPPYSKVSEKEVEIRFTDNNIILERYIIEKGSIPKFPAIPRKDGYVFVEWDKNVFTKVYENTTYVAKWISYKELGTRVICSFDLDGGIGTFPSAIVEKGTTVAEILEKNGLTSPIRQGYIFKGWNIENTTKITEDIVVKALWSRVE